MEQEQRKLTGRQASRYDRSMSEAAVIEQQSTYNQAVYDSWADDFANAQSSAEREGIWAAIKSGVSKGQKSVKELSDEQIKKMTDEMDTKESKERKRTAMEHDIDEFMEKNKKISQYTEKGDSHPKYELKGQKIEKENLNEKKDWTDIGWPAEAKTKVENKLKQIFTGRDALTEDERKSAIDLLAATGKTADEVLADMNSRESIPAPTPEEIYSASGSEEKARAFKKREWLAKFDISEKYVQRFILPDDFAAENEHDYQYGDPPNIEEVAWQIMHHYKHKNWGPHGDFPLLEMRIAKDKNGRVDPEKSKYYLNQSNFAVWARERMWSQYDQKNDIVDFMGAIDIPKTMGILNFQKMFPEFQKYFASEDGQTSYNYLAQELIVESAGLGTMNQIAVKYKQEMKDPEALQKSIGEMFASNVFTKETFRKNLIELLAIMPLRYEGNKPGELLESDGIFGSAINEMFLVYYNLSDFKGLQDLLGKGSSFFTRDSFLQAFQSVAEDKSG